MIIEAITVTLLSMTYVVVMFIVATLNITEQYKEINMETCKYLVGNTCCGSREQNCVGQLHCQFYEPRITNAEIIDGPGMFIPAMLREAQQQFSLLVTILNRRTWSYSVEEGQFYMVLGNETRNFNVNDTEAIVNLIQEIKEYRG